MFGQGWIGCDFDGTLAVAPSPYDPTAVGAPIPKMVARVKAWLAEGKDVRIFTARVAYVSPELLVKIEAAIQKFCFDNLGKVLPVTCIKDHDMLELWDDRARQVELNTGVLIRSIPDSSLTSGTDRAMEFLRVIKQYTEAFGDPDNWPVDSRENMFEMLRSSLREVVQKPFWSRLGIGYSNVSGQSFPEACALEAPHSLGPQGEPIYAEQGGVKRCVACICGGCEEHRYSEDQPRDDHGRFGSGESMQAAAKAWENSLDLEDTRERMSADIKAGTPENNPIIRGIREGSFTDTVFRGVVASEDWREPLDWKAGDTIQMLPSSFSTDKTVADAFAQGQVGVGVPSSPLDEDSTSVMLEVTGGGRGLSIPSSEKEIVTGGRFHIDAVAMYGEQLSIKMHQTGTW